MHRYLLCSLLVLLSGFLASGEEVRLRDGDIFRLVIGGPPRQYTDDFTLDYTIDAGVVELPMIGTIRAAGLTQTQLAAAIKKKLKDDKIFTNPNVIINMARAQASVVVGGAVRGAGRQNYVTEMTLVQAIAAAGGRSDFAKDGVRIVRAGKAISFSWKAIRKNPADDPKLIPGDFVEVDGDF